METKKYKIRKDLSYTFDGHKLYRVEALKDFGNVKKAIVGYSWMQKFTEMQKYLAML